VVVRAEGESVDVEKIVADLSEKVSLWRGEGAAMGLRSAGVWIGQLASCGSGITCNGIRAINWAGWTRGWGRS